MLLLVALANDVINKDTKRISFRERLLFVAMKFKGNQNRKDEEENK